MTRRGVLKLVRSVQSHLSGAQKLFNRAAAEESGEFNREIACVDNAFDRLRECIEALRADLDAHMRPGEMSSRDLLMQRARTVSGLSEQATTYAVALTEREYNQLLSELD